MIVTEKLEYYTQFGVRKNKHCSIKRQMSEKSKSELRDKTQKKSK
jgi:hypothetical protein